MAPSFNTIEKSKKWLFDYAQDPGKMLLHTATMGWILSAWGQIVGIINNKKISKKEKEFLIPQEVADAAINIASFFILTSSFQNFTKGLASKGKIITTEIKTFCNKHGIDLLKKEGKALNIGDEITKKINNFNAVLTAHEDKTIKIDMNLSNETRNEIDKEIKELTDFKNETFGPFESGLKVAGNVIGGVISGSIITPMLRNPMASWKQRSALDREQLEHDAKLYHENRIILAQNNYGMDAYKARVTTPGGGMKI